MGCSAEGAALCYRTICSEGANTLGAHAHPEVSLHTPSFARYVACLEAGDLGGVAALMLDSARRLQRAGADFLICPDNTIHQAFALVEPHSPLPWLHIAVAVARLTTSSSFVTCSTGISAGREPFRIRLASAALRFNDSVPSVP